MNVVNKRIYVGLSGGVDSAVTAALLKEAGALVTGVFIKGWYPPGMPCTWSADRRDAMRVAAKLRIPFYTLDASKEYKESVIDYLLAEYKAGRTPNPDIMCNREVKFGAFYRYAKAEGADFMATGHYAQLVGLEDQVAHEEGLRLGHTGPSKTHITKQPVHPHLLRGKSEAKDQSYFLWAVPKEVLDFTLFPLGGLEKEEVRRHAKNYGLPVSDKRDSQGICFLGAVSVDDFLRAELTALPGKAIDERGEVVGAHDGAVLYTLGEKVALTDAPSGPWFVIAKDVSANTLTVAHQKKVVKEGTGVFGIRDTNWLAPIDSETVYQAQYRYHGPKIPVKIERDGNRVHFLTDAPDTPALGQSLVIYQEDNLIGGGIIAADV